MREFRHSVLLSGILLLAEAHTEASHRQQDHHVRTHAHHHARQPSASSSCNVGDNALAIELLNNTPKDNIHAYVLTNHDGGVALITTEAQYFSPEEAEQGRGTMTPEQAKNGIPLGPPGSMTRLNCLPIGLLSARIIASVGPLDVIEHTASLSMPGYLDGTPGARSDWSFIEANLQGNTLYVNPTFVDFAGLPVDFDLVTLSSVSKYTGLGLDDIDQVCHQLEDEQVKDGQPWSHLCVKDSNGGNLRIKSPAHYEGFESYWEDYMDRIWKHYSTNDLTFVGKGGTSTKCRTDIATQLMTCNGTSAEFAKPSSSDIWGCAGDTTFGHSDPGLQAISPAFCAAIHRGLLLVPGGETQPSARSSSYYPMDQMHNKYASILHKQQASHTGYAFPYDDVKTVPDDDVSGLMVGNDPRRLRIYIGGRFTDQLAGPHSSPSNSRLMSPSFFNSSSDVVGYLTRTACSHTATSALSSTMSSSSYQ